MISPRNGSYLWGNTLKQTFGITIYHTFMKMKMSQNRMQEMKILFCDIFI